MKKIIKYILITLLILIVLVQFYPRASPNKEAGINPNDISVANKTTLGVQQILQVSCYDCHSNNTIYPWYSNIQPVSMWLNNHIIDGKKELNFSIFGSYSAPRKYKKLKEIIEQVKKDEMPLSSFTIIHRDAILNKEKKDILLNWASSEMELMKQNYPADSLVMKKK